MSLHVYVKEHHTTKKKVVNYVSYVTLIIGALLLFWSLYPILSFEIYSRLFIQNDVQTPVPKTEGVSSLEQANTVLGSFSAYSSNLRDFTKATVWFPTVIAQEKVVVKKPDVKDYLLSIPKLNIRSAKVVVGGEDLSKSLIQFMPQSLPGEYGNVIVFGHSTLPQLYNAKDYKTVFTFLPSLEKGDKITIMVNNLEYEYQVFDMFVINPDQISVLEQKQDASYLTLITCVPPGTYWKRLVIKAKLTQLPSN
jgi:sortase A